MISCLKMDGNFLIGQIMIKSDRRIYRGFKSFFPDGVYKNIFKHENRLPVDTNSIMHVSADRWFKNAFNISARSQTIICSTCLVQAVGYKSTNGSLAEIIPKGKFNIIYSPHVRDFLDYVLEIESLTDEDIASWILSKRYQCVSEPGLIPIDFYGEIMIDCEEFYLINIRDS